MTSRLNNLNRIALAAVAALLLAGLVVLTSVGSAPAGSAKILGNAGKTPPPSCPSPKRAGNSDPKACFVFASVTGFQVTANGKRPLFKVPSNGHLVGWSVDLSKPSKAEREDLADFGGTAARIQILKSQKKGRFKLTKQTPKVSLDKHLGKKPIFTLGKQMRVRKGTVVALSTNSWVSNFAHDGKLTSKDDKWRASRGSRKCGDNPNKSTRENQADLRKSKPHRKMGTTKKYGCTYGMGRILYWAYFVPDKRGGGN